ncbi:TlpA family protein disulfide reductase [Opitutus terrae]|uniref:Alkyl hydroperoxide reductase/ Thiol specific antioxidant/ Mal allergen n=1 Tax=Opitutus terrae (strain DSM 11246 / JCM 15787 / PB90-1) TaxID=452637 RepID=B1ZS54_OPITP|nr:TlpA disulfide reductase family protein [Opitutus terrae]ACB74730.1 alkyl hydroperoxide reductase/ Thiol specific antioxidant/ Mal allergen [Opitutus terrae PB90-1]
MSSPRRIPYGRLVLFALGALGAIFVINRLGARGSASAANSVPADQRSAAPAFSVTTLDGTPWSLESQCGKVVLVNFFATWCPPCRAEMPDLVKIAQDYRPKGVETIGLSLDEGGADVVQPFLKRYRVDFPVGLPEPGSAITAGITGIPVTLILDKSGRVARHYVGMISEEQVRGDLDALLAE